MRTAGGRQRERLGDSGPGDGGGGPGRHHRESWGKTLSGLVSAAVVTVLFIVVAGRVAGPDAVGRADGGQPAAAGEAMPSPQPAAPAKPAERPGKSGSARPDFEALMGTAFAFDPGLTGSGELVPVGGGEPAPDPGAATQLRYRVDVEAGLDLGGMTPELFAEAVHRTLNDGRSWANGGERGFARVSRGAYDFVVTLASPGTTAVWCAKSGLDTTEDNVSCDSSTTERVMINAWRWAQGSETYGEDIRGYRQMLINHEVGHRLGYGHVGCPEQGALAPVMMQQTKYLTTDGITCRPNSWPFPRN